MILTKDFSEFKNVDFDEWVSKLESNINKSLNYNNLDNFSIPPINFPNKINNFLPSNGLKLFTEIAITDKTEIFTKFKFNSISQLTDLLDLIHQKKDYNLVIKLESTNNFFTNICKFRALKKLINIYKNEANKNFNYEVVYVNSNEFQSDIEIENNYLRFTNDFICAFLAGADYFKINTNIHDDEYLRLINNIYHILNEESYLNFVKDPLSGAYFFEEYTEFLCSRAWDLFVDITELNQSIDKIYELEENSKNELIDNIDTNKLKLIGVNSYINSKNTLNNQNSTDIKLISKWEEFNLLKLNNKQKTEIPIFYVPDGVLKPRLDFVTEFYNSGSINYKIQEFDLIEDLIQFLSYSKNPIISFCSSDLVYRDILNEIKNLNNFSDFKEIVFFGNQPIDLEIESKITFINIKSNFYNKLRLLWDKILNEN